MPIDFAQKRVLIFIVAYNAETTISSVLSRIPAELRNPNVEVLIIDDSSKDNTFAAGLEHANRESGFRITILRNPVARTPDPHALLLHAVDDGCPTGLDDQLRAAIDGQRHGLLVAQGLHHLDRDAAFFFAAPGQVVHATQ